MGCVSAVAGSGKHQARPPTDLFEKILEETCPNHAYPVKHELRDCGMMNNFMSLGSLMRGMEADKDPDEGGATPFPGEDTVMTIYDGCTSSGVRHVYHPSPGAPAHYSWGCGGAGI
jgi:hypothetical protein